MIAVTIAGNTEVSSDGVTIVTENDVLSGVKIYDGKPCNVTGWLIFQILFLYIVLFLDFIELNM